jgi:hypothetical protein
VAFPKRHSGGAGTVAGQALGVIESGILAKIVVRIVAGRATDAGALGKQGFTVLPTFAKGLGSPAAIPAGVPI